MRSRGRPQERRGSARPRGYVARRMRVLCFLLLAVPALSLRAPSFGLRHAAMRKALRPGGAAAARPSGFKSDAAVAVAQGVARLQMTTASDAALESAPEGDGKKSKAMEFYLKTTTWLTNLFPLWTVIFATWALKQPTAFAWLTTEYFTGGLGLLMLSMGITLAPEDFARILQRPNAVIIGFLGCYVMMPALAYGLGVAFGLPRELIAGLVLVGSINGGQASNLCTYIANGNVALSVLMTTATTFGAIVFTPLLCKLLLGAVVPVNALGIAISTIQVVLAPIFIGMTCNKFFPKFVKAILPLTPVIGTFCTSLLVAASVAQCADSILAAGLALQLPVILLHVIGGLIGYSTPRMMGFSETSSRTMAIETAMKSSAFGFLLAKLHFADYAVRVPSAVSVVWMAAVGSLMAVIWRYIPVPRAKFDRSLIEKYPPMKLPWAKKD